MNARNGVGRKLGRAGALTAFTALGIAAAFMAAPSVRAAAGGIDPDYGFAWSENVGWINFAVPSGSVEVGDEALSGYAWSPLAGWINLHPSESAFVANNASGTLSGFAWGEGVGWIDFGGVSIDADGYFHGYATSAIAGRISFNCANTGSCASSDFKVRTEWRGGGDVTDKHMDPPPPVRSGGTGGGGSSLVEPGKVLAAMTSVTSFPKTPGGSVVAIASLPTAPPPAPKVAAASAASPPTFTSDLAFGIMHPEVLLLQRLLNRQGFTVALRGAGSSGLETQYFGAATRAALIRFQTAASEAAVRAESGWVGPATRGLLNRLAAAPPASSAPVARPCAAYLATSLRYGGANDAAEVRKLQVFLADDPAGKGLETTGFFGKNTLAAVRRFQAEYAVEILGRADAAPTGYVGPATLGTINKEYCRLHPAE